MENLIDKINKLEKIVTKLEAKKEIREKWYNEVNIFADNFLDNIHNIKAFEKYTTEEIKRNDFEISENGAEASAIAEEIYKKINKPGLNPASGGHLGYIPGGGVFAASLGDYIADVYNDYAGIYYAGPGAVKLENFLVRWMCGICGFPENSGGILTSGGSMATLSAIVAARDKHKIDGENIKQSVIYITKQAHHSVDKAIRIAGLANSNIRYIETDDRFRMKSENLEENIKKDLNEGLRPFLVVASAGTTDTGAIDPLGKISKITKENNLWLHTDAAYGGFFILVDKLKHKFEGIENSDSITIDPHKGLFLPYGTGALLVKDIQALAHSHFYTANYMQDKIETVSEPSPADLSPELTKHFRGLRMYFPLKLHGLEVFRAALEEKYLLTEYFYEEVQKIGFEVGHEPELSVMIYRYIPKKGDADEFNLNLVEAVKNDGRVFISSTTLDKKIWLRLAVLSFRSHRFIIDVLLKVLRNATKNH